MQLAPLHDGNGGVGRGIEADGGAGLVGVVKAASLDKKLDTEVSAPACGLCSRGWV